MNFVASNLSGAGSPLGLEPTGPFADFGNSSTSRLLSDSHSNSTDTSNDPTPDGPEMENGNENCHSPESDSVCSFAAECDDDNRYTSGMGTPNSFVGQLPMSPDMFSDYEPRERMFSTSSSTFTYSPYTPREDDPIPVSQSCVTPAFNRQTSLAMVEEVLGATDDCTQPMTPLFTEEDSPVKPFDEDSCLPPYPSPSFVAHFNASSDQAKDMTLSQGEAYYALFCNNDDTPVLVRCEGSPTTDSNQSNNNNCSNGDSQNIQSPVAQEVTSETVEQPSLEQPVWPISRQPSNFSDILTDTMPSNSLDTQEMLQDCLNALPGVTQTKLSYPTLNIEILAIENPPLSPTGTEAVVEHPELSPKSACSKTSPLVTLSQKDYSEPSTSISKGDVSDARRERNNEACRQSRKRRKSKKDVMEGEVVRYTEENVELRVKIEQLEVECKRMKQSILSAMTTNNSR